MNKMGGKKLFLHCIMEACGLGIFMLSAGFFTILLFHPYFQKVVYIPSPWLRQILIGICMGGTAFFIITNAWLSRSGAHINPAISICFFYLGRITKIELLGYILSQFLGGVIGLEILNLVWGKFLGDPSIRYIVTIPGSGGPILAMFLELGIAFILMTLVLLLGKSESTRKFTPYLVAFLVFMYAAFESPYTGFGMNPARTFASAFLSGIWTHYWIYVFCPILGMFLASYLFKNHSFHPHFGLGKPKHHPMNL